MLHLIVKVLFELELSGYQEKYDIKSKNQTTLIFPLDCSLQLKALKVLISLNGLLYFNLNIELTINICIF